MNEVIPKMVIRTLSLPFNDKKSNKELINDISNYIINNIEINSHLRIFYGRVCNCLSCF